MKKALCCGRNVYTGGGDLSECVNDAVDMNVFLDGLGFDVEVLVDYQVTRANMENKLIFLAEEAVPGDFIVWSYSGHGTNYYDVNSDEDGYDEAIYPDELWLDDDIRKILDLFQVGVHLTVIFDSCFSDNSTDLRFISPVRRIGKAKFFKLMDIPSDVGRKKRILKAHNAVEVLMAGCGDKEYSYDAPRLGNGAFTAYFLKSYSSGDTYSNCYKKLRSYLPSDDYPQTPQFRGDSLDHVMFMDTVQKKTCKFITWIKALWKRLIG